jgi:hypothetical protein
MGREMDRGADAMTSGTAAAGGHSPRSSRRADVSLALGVAGLVLGFLLLFAILTPAAILTAIAALKEIRVHPGLRGRWKAWTGIGLAVVAPVLWVSAFLAIADNSSFGIF